MTAHERIKNAKDLLRTSRAHLSKSRAATPDCQGRLHTPFVTIERVPSRESKSKGVGLEIFYGTHETPFGECLVGLTDRGVCHLAFVTSSRAALVDDLKIKWLGAAIHRDQPGTGAVVERILSPGDKGSPSVLLVGTSFQLKVWKALLMIPEGQVSTYSDIARFIQAPAATRAVGTAIGSNTIAWLVPCHRVIREGGAFSRYRWGADRKKAMLLWESAQSERVNPP